MIRQPFEKELQMLGYSLRATRVSVRDVADHAGRAAELTPKDAVRDLHVSCVRENSAGIERITTDIIRPKLLIHNYPPVLGTARVSRFWYLFLTITRPP